ncbi:unnamed protein product [Parnassius apollo]|uniref:(apollo) hypothetical protein n=1 Tax=Parnassius apollo TaxID=110799 RepID=A0A8S3Y492_PARAO|nr:unnamed protein product [Parnassius apollo]
MNRESTVTLTPNKLELDSTKTSLNNFIDTCNIINNYNLETDSENVPCGEGSIIDYQCSITCSCRLGDKNKNETFISPSVEQIKDELEISEICQCNSKTVITECNKENCCNEQHLQSDIKENCSEKNIEYFESKVHKTLKVKRLPNVDGTVQEIIESITVRTKKHDPFGNILDTEQDESEELSFQLSPEENYDE